MGRSGRLDGRTGINFLTIHIIRIKIYISFLSSSKYRLRTLQETCIRSGIDKVGVPDLMVAQQAMRLDVPLFSIDKHFALIAQIAPLRLWLN